ncbi:STAS domain-containing protein [Chloroflexus sp. MS-CIW-1]|jgi:anti-sigma B factor antagonist|uniref:STAS domain-containing protein n=1 Tax=Chloroflexus sp. MS-CIW-1 TaxID=3055768 RepID=UPI001B0BB9DC|nr:STAS domain-containing protein [Chloroflexus sp. MS-CIW-1]MBO9346641.1 STAS domain-containing protein [Chloroflexus sp.]MDN5271486.1 STAS domain-containing protein [Chloroflexus sp. MS-CIW-1]
MEMKPRTVGNVAVLAIEGRFDANTAPTVQQWLEQATAMPGARVLVDLSATTFVDSTALATLVSAMKRCQQGQGAFALCGLRRPVLMIFELTRLDKAFNIFVDADHALAVLNS